MSSGALDVLPESSRRLLVAAPQPSWIDPMLATLTERRFSDPSWIFERKLDGERCFAYRRGPELRLLSRNKLVVNAQYPELVGALFVPGADDFVVDGEIVSFEGNRTSFARLQRRMHVSNPDQARRSEAPVFYYLFDVVFADGHDLRKVALRDRKSVLRRLLRFTDPVRFTTHRNSEGESFYREACSKGWEGLIAKRADATYEGGRSRAWLKFKCEQEQEFVIGGYTDPQGGRTSFGALLIGYYQGNDLVYAGKVGTGLTREVLADLLARMQPLERHDPPFTVGTLPRRGVHWIQPEMVGQVGFSEWTADGQLRHPRFLGVRRDKPAREVTRERPV